MKAIQFFLIVALLAISPALHAQQYIAHESDVSMGKSKATAWVMKVDEPLDALKKGFAKYAKSQWNVRMKRSGQDMLIAKEANIPSISQNQGDLMAKFYALDGDNAIAVAFMPGYSISLNTYDNTEEMNNLKKFVKNFVKTFKSDQLQEAISLDEKRLRQLQSTLKKNEREYQSLNKKISRTENSIEKEENENKVFDLKNKNIANRARLAALDAMMVNLKDEINSMQDMLAEHRAALGSLEERFVEDPFASTTPDE